ncbi:DUF3841 domain-containing protein [Gemella cuniculi]|uniref:DUF3841 domain-containing protein n=1 Tax=Gemella cuniculi TaxID=150240 RepID=UPI000403BA8D|nr:DUF3841 domain-containing protein [Gemella cuniculi]
MKTVNLYTKQPINSIYELELTDSITNNEIYIRLHMKDISDSFLEKYSLFTKMAEKIIPHPKHIKYPIWCSVSKSNCLKPTDNEVVYCLEVPIDEVIYFDSLKWNYVLNNIYIPKDYNDKINFLKKLNEIDLKNSYTLFSEKNGGLYPKLENEIKRSWKRIFKIDDWNEFTVQANLWQIKKEWVKYIIKPGENFHEITKDMKNTFPPKFRKIYYSKRFD